ncbi:uncharacterized protein PFLUO_LOCUS1892 [Penicillium psychrofluorescens]|uniref:uncharacterized protein n=1 Tax=Penicillium psychrofluorescens TaxID=3158075 RepID=UPI003CCD5A90
MLRKKFLWSTPINTPELSPASSDSDSDSDMDSSSRPVSLAVSVGAFGPMRPTLKEILANTAPPPYTLSAFMAYLSQNHCLETLEFTLEAKRYRETYYNSLGQRGQVVLAPNSPEGQHLRMLWQRLLTAYIFPGAPREINLSSEVRDALLRHINISSPPPPETLDSAVKRIHDLMEESIFLPFLNSQVASPSMGPLSDTPPGPEDHITLSTACLDENPVKRVRSWARRTSPQSSTKDLSSPVHGHHAGRSNLSLSAVHHVIGKRASGPFSSASGDSCLTDESSSPQSSPTVEEPITPMTPPTTPPANEPNMPVSSPRGRTDNPWKKMGMKLGFKKRSGGASRDPRILGLDDQL